MATKSRNDKSLLTGTAGYTGGVIIGGEKFIHNMKAFNALKTRILQKPSTPIEIENAFCYPQSSRTIDGNNSTMNLRQGHIGINNYNQEVQPQQ